MRKLLPAAFLPLLSLLIFSGGCGNEISHALTDDGGSQPPGDDERSDGGEGDCGAAIPAIACADPCGGGSLPLQCIDGIWQCPPFNGIACIEDAGADACSYTVGACGGETYCTGVYQVPVCEDGTWSCQWEGECEDAGEPDAGYPIDAPSTTPFACGDEACDPSTRYCQISTGGPVNPDGGPSSGYSCEKLPTSCAPGTQATCDCVTAFQGNLPGACSCIAENGDVIVTCDEP